MIATERFVFVHLHKSGGTFFIELLRRFVPGVRQIGYHLPRSMVPPTLAHLPVLGFVRNPWSYYVSWYSFQARRPQPNALFRVLSEDGRLDFEHTVSNMLSLGTTGAHLDALIAALPKAYLPHGLNLPGFALERLRGSGLGFYAYLYQYLYDGPGIMHMGRMERMREEILPMLTAVGEPVSAAMRSYLLETPASNVSAHEAYARYYGAALRDLVAERDAEIIERYGYRFGE